MQWPNEWPRVTSLGIFNNIMLVMSIFTEMAVKWPCALHRIRHSQYKVHAHCSKTAVLMRGRGCYSGGLMLSLQPSGRYNPEACCRQVCAHRSSGARRGSTHNSFSCPPSMHMSKLSSQPPTPHVRRAAGSKVCLSLSATQTPTPLCTQCAPLRHPDW